jgi:uncharacterized protein (TIGR03435 family)
MFPGWLSPIANHLWQSTIFAAVAALLALGLRKNQARIRFGLWLIASLKFLVPFSILIVAGRFAGLTSESPAMKPLVSSAVEQIVQPWAIVQTSTRVGPSIQIIDSFMNGFVVPGILVGLWFAGFAAVLWVWFKRWSRARAVVDDAIPVAVGRELRMLRRLEQLLGIRSSVQLFMSAEQLEPGVIGVLHPALVLPAGISEHLTDTQLEAIFIHELSHVRRRDNLASAFHVFVESVFWFHPLVWWLEKRLVTERERACDEEVLRFNGDAEAYADAILKICEFYLQAPLTCVAGVTGSGLVKRVEDILSTRVVYKLNGAKKLALACAAMLAIAVPVAIGVANPQKGNGRLEPPKGLAFEAASVKPNTSGERRYTSRMLPGGAYTATNNTLRDLILNAYWVPEYLLTGDPDWIKNERFDIEAKPAPNTVPPGLPDRVRNEYTRSMIQTLLAERFKLAVHREKKEMSIYELVVSKNGPKLKKAADRDCINTNVCHNWGPGNPTMEGGYPGTSVDMDDLVDVMSLWVDRPVVNKTNIQGIFDIRIQFNPRPGGQVARSDQPNREVQNADPASLPSLFTALEEQLGLKLESRKGLVETLVVDHVERPSSN